MKRIIYIICVISLLCIILLYPMQSFEGAKIGLNLWFHTIIPTLLPFIIISNIMISLNATNSLSSLISPFTKRTLKISKHANYAIIIGMLCGFPMGAKVVNDLVIHNKISKTEGQYLLSFCNNASPMFIISFIVHTILNSPDMLYKILIIIYGAPFICAILFNFSFRKKSRENNCSDISRETNKPVDFNLVDECIIKSFEVVIKLGGYLIMFSIISYFFIYFIDVNYYIKSLIVGFIEITTGINYIGFTYIPQIYKALIICVLTSFGGLSTLAQTQSVIKESGLSIFNYFICKLVNTFVAAILAFFIL